MVISAMRLTVLLVAMQAIILPGAMAQQSDVATAIDGTDEFLWGEVTDGLQLRISTGVNTEALTGTALLLYLQVAIRNVSDRPAGRGSSVE